MDFADKVNDLVAQIPKRLEHTNTEEATKNALIMPLIAALGYDVFNPSEVVPEYTADVGVKKGEKVDYAIIKDGNPIIIIEAKSASTNLSSAHISQLFRYFATTDVRFGILTNGIEWRFYSDLEKPNKMDDHPFLVIDMQHIRAGQIDELKKFTKTHFDIESIISNASELKYARTIKELIAQEVKNPSEEFIRLFAGQVYEGRFTQSVKEQFAEITKQAFKQYVNERVANRLKSALANTTDTGETLIVDDYDDEPEEIPEEEKSTSRVIVTTQDEVEGFFVLKSILREAVDSKRIVMRDTQSYCGVLLDDNNRKPLARMHFNRTQYYLGIFDADKNEERIAIDNLDDIYQYADKLKATVGYYES